MTLDELKTYVRQVRRSVSRLPEGMDLIVVEVSPRFYPRIFWGAVEHQLDDVVAEVHPTSTIGETRMLLQVKIGEGKVRVVPHYDANWSRLVCRDAQDDIVYFAL